MKNLAVSILAAVAGGALGWMVPPGQEAGSVRAETGNTPEDGNVAVETGGRATKTMRDEGTAASYKALRSKVMKLETALARGKPRTKTRYDAAPELLDKDAPHTRLNSLESPFGSTVDFFYWSPEDREEGYVKYVESVRDRHDMEMERYRKIAESILPGELTEEQLQTHEQYRGALERYDQLQREYINRRLLPQGSVTEEVAQEDATTSEELAQLKRQLWKLRNQERKNLCSAISARLADGDAAKAEALNGSILKLIGTHRADYYW